MTIGTWETGRASASASAAAAADNTDDGDDAKDWRVSLHEGMGVQY